MKVAKRTEEIALGDGAKRLNVTLESDGDGVPRLVTLTAADREPVCLPAEVIERLAEVISKYRHESPNGAGYVCADHGYHERQRADIDGDPRRWGCPGCLAEKDAAAAAKNPPAPAQPATTTTH